MVGNRFNKDSTLQPIWKHLREYGVSAGKLQMWSFDASLQPQTLRCLPYNSEHSFFGEWNIISASWWANKAEPPPMCTWWGLKRERSTCEKTDFHRLLSGGGFLLRPQPCILPGDLGLDPGHPPAEREGGGGRPILIQEPSWWLELRGAGRQCGLFCHGLGLLFFFLLLPPSPPTIYFFPWNH